VGCSISGIPIYTDEAGPLTYYVGGADPEIDRLKTQLAEVTRDRDALRLRVDGPDDATTLAERDEKTIARLRKSCKLYVRESDGYKARLERAQKEVTQLRATVSKLQKDIETLNNLLARCRERAENRQCEIERTDKTIQRLLGEQAALIKDRDRWRCRETERLLQYEAAEERAEKLTNMYQDKCEAVELLNDAVGQARKEMATAHDAESRALGVARAQKAALMAATTDLAGLQDLTEKLSAALDRKRNKIHKLRMKLKKAKRNS
jgi:chromosome segregation ATPase